MIELTNLCKSFGPHIALDNVTLTIGEGDCFGFIGPNGAGKSTTMKILSGLLLPTSGTAAVCGRSVLTEPDAVRPLIGYMPDFLGVYEDLTVDEYLQFFAAAYLLPRLKRRIAVDGVLQLVDLSDKRDAMVDSLSRGMQQRLGIARVLLHEPKVLLLDEPASGLDPRARIELRELILELRRMGKTIMVSSHILSELAEMTTSLGIIEKGKMLFAGSVEQAFRQASIGDRVEVKLELPPDADVRLAHLNLAERLRRDERISAAEYVDDGLQIDLTPMTDGTSHGHHFLIAAIIEAGSRIESFTPKQVKLEDAFLRLTKGALN